jgi:glycosyltransferase involved in cell wall biosynthesis
MVQGAVLIRVGFQPIGGAGWLGGRNYLWNLLHALRFVEKPQLQPVLLSARGEADELLLAGVEHFERRGALASVWARRVGTATTRLFGRNLVDEYWLRQARVDVFSHGPPLGARSRVPWIFWIPDVQHRRFPAFFSSFERRDRDAFFSLALRHAAAVVTSSAAARDDLVRFYGNRAERVRVLHFVSSPRVDLGKLAPLDDLRRRLDVPARYFHLPNQFWKHKNHDVVISALAEAVRVEKELVVIATGAKDDYRNPRFYDELMARVRGLGLADRFRHLGTVSYDDLMALMRHSVAVINPSLFEGWSSTVEEAKSIGKTVLLSDIDVHREQAPARGHFFAADDPAALTDLLVETWRAFDSAADDRAIAEAARALPDRVRAFGAGYQAIVVAAVQSML